MTYEEFVISNDKLKEYRKQQEKLDAILEIISPSGTGVVEFGNEFADDYIRLISISIKDYQEWYSWFVYENNYGKKKLSAFLKGKKYDITDCKSFYDFITLLNATD